MFSKTLFSIPNPSHGDGINMLRGLDSLRAPRSHQVKLLENPIFNALERVNPFMSCGLVLQRNRCHDKPSAGTQYEHFCMAQGAVYSFSSVLDFSVVRGSHGEFVPSW